MLLAEGKMKAAHWDSPAKNAGWHGPPLSSVGTSVHSSSPQVNGLLQEHQAHCWETLLPLFPWEEAEARAAPEPAAPPALAFHLPEICRQLSHPRPGQACPACRSTPAASVVT